MPALHGTFFYRERADDSSLKTISIYKKQIEYETDRKFSFKYCGSIYYDV